MKHLENRPSGGVLSSSLQALNFPGGWFLPLEESGGGRRTSAPSCYLRHVANPARSPRTTCSRRPCTQGRRSWRGDRGGKEKDHNLRANANTAWSPPAISLFLLASRALLLPINLSPKRFSRFNPADGSCRRAQTNHFSSNRSPINKVNLFLSRNFSFKLEHVFSPREISHEGFLVCFCGIYLFSWIILFRVATLPCV